MNASHTRPQDAPWVEYTPDDTIGFSWRANSYKRAIARTGDNINTLIDRCTIPQETTQTPPSHVLSAIFRLPHLPHYNSYVLAPLPNGIHNRHGDEQTTFLIMGDHGHAPPGGMGGASDEVGKTPYH